MKVAGISSYKYTHRQNLNKVSTCAVKKESSSNTAFKGNFGRYFGAILGGAGVLAFVPACPVLICAGPLVAGLLSMYCHKVEEDIKNAPRLHEDTTQTN